MALFIWVTNAKRLKIASLLHSTQGTVRVCMFFWRAVGFLKQEFLQTQWGPSLMTPGTKFNLEVIRLCEVKWGWGIGWGRWHSLKHACGVLKNILKNQSVSQPASQPANGGPSIWVTSQIQCLWVHGVNKHGRGQSDRDKEKGGRRRGSRQRVGPTYNREYERAQNVPQRAPGDGGDPRVRHHAL